MRIRIAAFAAALGLVLGACADQITPPTHTRVQHPTISRDVYDSGGGDTHGAQLLACPSRGEEESSVGVIGPEGGSLAVGATRLDVPPGAVPTETTFEILLPRSAFMEVEIRAVGTEHYVFDRPVVISIDLSRCGLDASSFITLQSAYIDSDTKVILELLGGSADPDAQTLTFQTGHLSGYAVAE